MSSSKHKEDSSSIKSYDTDSTITHKTKEEDLSRGKSHNRLSEIAHIFSGMLSGKNSLANSPTSSPSVSRKNSSISLHKLSTKLEELQHRSSSGSNSTSSASVRQRLARGSSSDTVRAVAVPKKENKVKETHQIHLEYDPVSKRRVLNTYEILKDLGAGQHGKVKLARDIESNRLVAIKIVDRKSKPRLGRFTKPGNTQEDKIRKEIAIMKKCDHVHVVRLLEVLDAENSRKIYMVLEYLEKGEIEWQMKDERTGEERPFLRFIEARQVFRDVVSGLEYLHYQGIIHRDIKPSNLLVSKDNVVKISDFGVSFAANLDGQDEYELAKTAGTPAFLAPELCQTEGYNYEVPVTAKIDIWALGVTLFCLLFGKLPFNGESEFALFESINKNELQFPPKSQLRNHESVSDQDFNDAKDIISKLLVKSPQDRIDIDEIKQHPFFSAGLSRSQSKKYSLEKSKNVKIDVTTKEVDEAVIGIGNRIKRGIASALKRGAFKNGSATGSSSSSFNSDHRLLLAGRERSHSLLDDSARDHSLILSETVDVMASPTVEKASFTPDSPLLQSMKDLHVRKGSITGSIDSVSSGSAGIIETKQNVEGDLYLGRRDSAALQLAELIDKDKRRKSVSTAEEADTEGYESDFAPLTTTNSERSGIRADIPTAVTPGGLPEIAPNASPFFESSNRVSLPITDSFASLNSFYDDRVYPEISSPISPTSFLGAGPGISGARDAAYHRTSVSSGFPMRKQSTVSPPSTRLPSIDHTVFKESYKDVLPRPEVPTAPASTSGSVSPQHSATPPLVAKPPSRPPVRPLRAPREQQVGSFYIEKSSSDEDDDEAVAKPTTPVHSPFARKVQFSSLKNSDSDADSDDSDKDEDELTLIFSPKRPDVQRQLMHRAMSHESNLPTLKNFARQQDNDDEMLTTTSPFAVVDTPLELQVELGVKPIEELKESQRTASPLSKNVPAAPNATTDASSLTATKVSYVPSHYQNHYNKEHMVIPFQSKALHYHGKGKKIGDESRIEKQTVVPSREELNLADNEVPPSPVLDTAPVLKRNNSITIGILQHEKDV